MQIDGAISGKSMRFVTYSTITPGSIAANSNTEVTTAGVDINVGESGLLFFPSSVTPANNVRGNLIRCTAAGSIIASYNNPTAGALTPTASSAAAPYVGMLISTAGL